MKYRSFIAEDGTEYTKRSPFLRSGVYKIENGKKVLLFQITAAQYRQRICTIIGFALMIVSTACMGIRSIKDEWFSYGRQ